MFFRAILQRIQDTILTNFNRSWLEPSLLKQESLPRKRQRHTARHLASTPYVVLTMGGYPSWLGVSHTEVNPPPPPETGVPPPESTWDQWKYYGMEMGTPPSPKGHGTSESIMGWRWGTPPPPGVDGYTSVKTVSSLVLRTRAVIKCYNLTKHDQGKEFVRLYPVIIILCNYRPCT